MAEVKMIKVKMAQLIMTRAIMAQVIMVLYMYFVLYILYQLYTMQVVFITCATFTGAIFTNEKKLVATESFGGGSWSYCHNEEGGNIYSLLSASLSVLRK